MATFRVRILARNDDGTPHKATDRVLNSFRPGKIVTFARPLADGYYGDGVGRVLVLAEEESPQPLVTVEEVSKEEEERYWAGRNRYRLRLVTEAGVRRGGTFITKRRFEASDLVNLPDGPDRQPSPRRTSGHTWRVLTLEDPDILTLEYLRPWREGDPRCCG